MTDLPVDIDSTYPDRDPGDALHQQHHDFLHALHNELKGSDTAAGVATLRALLDGTYAPDDRPVIIPPSQFMLAGASFSLLGTRWPGILFDGAAEETASTWFQLPATWDSYNVDLWWTNEGVGSGNVVWGYQRAELNVGDSANTFPGAGAPAVTAAAGAQYIIRETRVASGLAATPGEIQGVRLYRHGTDVADTLGNDTGMLGLFVRKAS